MEDFVQFLSSTLNSLEIHYIDPETIHKAACAALKHFSSQTLEKISTLPKFNILSVYNLNLDLAFLEEHFINSPIRD